MRVAVVGAGRVGTVTAAIMARLGHDVVLTESDPGKTADLRAGHPPFFEPGLQDLLGEVQGAGKLSVSDSLAEAVSGAEVAFVCVGTPPGDEGDADLEAFERCVRQICEAADGPLVIAEKSTVPAGTSARVQGLLSGVAAAADLDIVSNPEFLREGTAIEDGLRPERILVGAESARAFDVMRRLYQPFADAGVPIIETDAHTAELSKHAVNAFLAMKVSFINAVARVAEAVGADVRDVSRVMETDSRVGKGMLSAGIGFGGSCFHKDLTAFYHLASDAGYDFPLLLETVRLNDQSVETIEAWIVEALMDPEGERVALLGLAFKPGTDDVRHAPALDLAKRLIARGLQVTGYDPEAGPEASREVPGLETAVDPYEAASGASCIVLCTEWPEFAGLDLERLAAVVAHRTFIDARNLMDPEAVRAAGFEYRGVGHSH